MAVTKNAVGGKGFKGGHVGEAGKRKGMAARPNSPARSKPGDNVRQLRRRLWVAAKQSPERRFHALHSAPLGTLVRYADDLVVVCKTKQQCEEAENRVKGILARLGLELHPEKTRRVALYDGEQGFDFLGCHLHKRLSGPIWERERKRVYFLHRWPSRRAMKRVREKVRKVTPRGRCHADLRVVIADLNPILRGWGRYFGTGNAARHFRQIDTYVYERLRGLRIKRAGRQLSAGESKKWTRDFFHNLGLHRLRGTVKYPEAVTCR